MSIKYGKKTKKLFNKEEILKNINRRVDYVCEDLIAEKIKEYIKTEEEQVEDDYLKSLIDGTYNLNGNNIANKNIGNNFILDEPKSEEIEEFGINYYLKEEEEVVDYEWGHLFFSSELKKSSFDIKKNK